MLPIPVINRPPESAELQRMRVLKEEAIRALQATSEECAAVRAQLAHRPVAGAQPDPESLIRGVLDADPHEVPTTGRLTLLEARRRKLQEACDRAESEVERLERQAGFQLVRQYRPLLRAFRLATLEAASNLAAALKAETDFLRCLAAAGASVEDDQVILCEGHLRTGPDFAEQVAIQRKELQYDERLDGADSTRVRLTRDAKDGPVQVKAGSIVKVAGCVASACLQLGLAEPVDQARRGPGQAADSSPDLVDLARTAVRQPQRPGVAQERLS